MGRYPAPMHRPRSKYSIGTMSAKALDDLFATISSKGARAVLTFPDHACSNGLSGDIVRKTAKKYFRISEEVVKSKFSTLGGNGRLSKTGKKGRAARQKANELILVLQPK